MAKAKESIKNPKPPKGGSGEVVPVHKILPPKNKTKKRTRALTTTRVDLPTEWSKEKGLQDFINLQKRLMDFVKDNLKEGTDYGPMYPGDTKKNLLVAGTEKVVLWLRLVERIFPDVGSFQMLGSPAKTVCYVDYLIRYQDIPQADKLIKKYGIENEEMVYRMLSITSGRGAATVNGTTVADANVAVKKGRIRAKKDAVLSLGLHNEFTQDAEDYGDGSDSESNVDVQTTKAKKEKPKTTKKGLEKLKEDCLQEIENGAFPAKQEKSLQEHTEELFKNKNDTALDAFLKSIVRQAKANKAREN